MDMRQNYRNKKAVKPIRKFYENEKDTVIADIEEDFSYDVLNSIDKILKRYESKYRDFDIDFFELLTMRIGSIMDILYDEYDE